MSRGLVIMVLALFGFQTMAFAVADSVEAPVNIRNNMFFIESLRYNNMARLALDEGNYVASTQFSEEAIRYANLSDEYVLLQLKILECDTAIAAARRRLEFAETVNAAARYPAEFNMAQTAFNDARSLRTAEKWDDATAAANRVLAFLARVEELPEELPVPPLPSQYVVRTWENERDCLWNIAARPYVYNDPWQWRRLYDANRDRMPQKDNPNLINPGMVLAIPSIGGESRMGIWEDGREYPAIR